MLAALFVGILTAISYLRAQNKLQIHTFALIILTVILIDTWRIDKMFLNYVNPNRVPPQERVNANAVAFLKRDNTLFRVLALPDHNQMPLPGIDLVTGFNDFAIRRYDNILKSGSINNPAILNLLNTKYIVAPSELNIPYLQKIAGRQGLHIYRNPGALPWFYLVPQYEIIPDENQTLQKLGTPNTHPTQTALLEEDPGITSDTQTSETDSIERLEYNEHQGYLKLKTTAPGPRILVISQNHHPNWHATVNGEPKPLIRANYLWTAVALAPGEHIVELTYRDPIVGTTRWITLGGVILLLIAIPLCIYNEKTTTPTEKSAIQRIARGAIQTFGSTYPARLINFAVILLLYQILVPEDFGAIATAYSILALVIAIRDLGLHYALLHDHDNVHELAPTHFVLSVSLGSISTLLALCLAVYSEQIFELTRTFNTYLGITDTYAQQNYPKVAIALGILGAFDLFRTAALTAETQLQRDLEFGRLAFAHAARNHPRSPRRPRPRLPRIRQMGTHPRILPVQRHLYPRLLHRPLAAPSPSDRPATHLQPASRAAHDPLRHLVLDRRHTQNFRSTLRQTHHQPIFTLSLRGIYDAAHSFAQIPSGAITMVIVRITVTVYARYQNNRDQLSAAYRRTSRLILRTTVPISLVLALEANRWIHIIKPEWAPRSPLLQWLIIYSLCRPLLDDVHALFYSVGSPKSVAKFAATQALILLILAPYLAHHMGAIGIAISMNAIAIVGLILSLILVRTYVDFPIARTFAPHSSPPPLARACTLPVPNGSTHCQF